MFMKYLKQSELTEELGKVHTENFLILKFGRCALKQCGGLLLLKTGTPLLVAVVIVVVFVVVVVFVASSSSFSWRRADALP